MSTRFTVTLPDIGEGVAEGEVIEWLKNVGDAVAQDEPVVVVMTDKATVELPAPYPGVLVEKYHRPGEKALVNHPLYDIELNVDVKPQKKEPLSHAAPFIKKPCTAEKSKVLALPKTRSLAKERGIDLSTVLPTGKHGEVAEVDLTKGASEEDEVAPLIGVRHLMSKKMVESKQNIPHFSYFEHADATRLIQLRENIKIAAANEGISATFMPFFIRALSLTISKYPLINSSVQGSNITIHRRQNIGVAISTEHGLIVVNLKNVQAMKLQEIIRSYDALKKRALSNRLTPLDTKDSTITLSNFGPLSGSGQWATPIINYPESAILALARIQKLPVVKNEQLVIRDTLNLSWSFDHRIIDGELAAKVSYFYATLIANPANLL